MKRLISSAMLTVCFLAACNGSKQEGDKVAKTENATTPIDTAAMNKAWANYMSPGAPHQMMAKLNGKWKAEISFHAEGQPPSSYEAVCLNEMILGGRYQKSVYQGQIDGMPFEGVSTMAFDNSRKLYIGTWIDNMGTGVMYLEGTYDETTKTITMKGKGVDVTTGKEMQMRETWKFIDDKTQLMEMFDTKDGKESKSMSIRLTKS